MVGAIINILKMEVKLNRATITSFLLFLLTTGCANNNEPAFSIKGEKDVLKDIKVNIEVMTDTSMAIASLFHQGNEFPVNNEGALRYHIYISYKDSLFSFYETDNLHGKLEGEPVNDLIIQQAGGKIVSIYNPFKDKDMPKGIVLQTAKEFFAGKTTESIDKFTGLYKKGTAVQVTAGCKEGESLVFEGKTLSSYTEDKMRGQGVLSFTLDVNDRLDILNQDETSFGEIVLNEDLTYFSLTMPKKIVARKVIPNYDFAAFDFDAEDLNSDKEYFLIYINKEQKKVKKSDLKVTYATWEDYIKEQTIKLKDCNLLVGSQGKGLAFTVTEIKGDEMNIKSTRDCFNEDISFQNIEGRVKWKSGNTLIVDFTSCN